MSKWTELWDSWIPLREGRVARNFASHIILPGRSFVSHLIGLSTKVRKLSHYVHLNIQCQSEISMWRNFLANWNCISMFYDCCLTSAADAASTVGFGGVYGKKWFASRWPPELPESLAQDQVLSMAFMELYPIVVAAMLWGHEW